MSSKTTKLLLGLSKEKIDALLVSCEANISYITGFPSRESHLVISKKGSFYITDSRYTEEAKKQLKGISVQQTDGYVFKKISEICNTLRLRCVGFEERHLVYSQYKLLRKHLKDSIGLVPTYGFIESLRRVKDTGEISKLKKATLIAVKAFEFTRRLIRPGMREIEVAGEIERFIRYNGASCSSFDIIVASGPNSSYPHHLTSERKIRNNDAVLVDMGVDYQGYKSDLTRVFFLGKIDILAKKIYKVALAAQSRALQAIKPGVKASKVDEIARDYIRSEGFGRYFSHALGHGIGLEVHEEPHISNKQDTVLVPGMVFTVEPAIYLPDKFGVRVEDMVLLTRKGIRLLSGSLNK